MSLGEDAQKAQKTTFDLSKAENIFNFYTRIVWLAYLTVIGKWKKAKAANI